MIRALVTGTLYELPIRRIGKSGKPFTTAKLRADTGDGTPIWCSVIAFADAAERLATLKAGAAISVSGRAKLSAWTGKDGEPVAGLDLVVDELAPLRSPPKPKEAPPRVPQTAPDFDDDLPEMRP